MCGIAGIVGGGDRCVLERMVDVQSHRGPDDRGVVWFDDASAGLAHRRLSILDLSPAGHQPMVNADGARWIVYNGELYNYRELRVELQSRGHRFHTGTDTEVLLAAWDEWGLSALDRFDGMFAFAIWDTRTEELTIARDHLGVKPLYYLQNGPMFAFASEAKGLFEIDGIERRIDPDAVASALLLLWVPEPATGYQGVMKLEAGSYAVVRDGRVRIDRYWDVPVGLWRDRTPRREEEYVEELREILERTVSRQMIGDVPVGAFLSGGLDSSIVVALMRKASSGTIRTYTIAFSDEDKRMESMSDDAHYAAQVSRLFDTEHHQIEARQQSNELLDEVLWHMDDPVLDGAAINTLLICREARESGTPVLLNGMGGDELFGGYRKQLASLAIERYRRIPRVVRNGMIEPLVNSLPSAVGGHGFRLGRWAKRFVRGASLPPLDAFIHGFAYMGIDELRAVLGPWFTARSPDDLYTVRRYHELASRVADLPLIDRMIYLDMKLFLPGINLLYSDKGSMAASIESRPPLIGREVVEFMARIPGEYRIRGRVQKYLLKRAAEAWLPRQIIHRPKAPFGTPIRAWMRRDLGERVRRTFEGLRREADPVLRPDLPLRLLAEHRSGRHDHAHRLWGLYALVRWSGLQKQGGRVGAVEEGVPV